MRTQAAFQTSVKQYRLCKVGAQPVLSPDVDSQAGEASCMPPRCTPTQRLPAWASEFLAVTSSGGLGVERMIGATFWPFPLGVVILRVP